jgi:alkylated DNA repair dioxygenase AlkB
VQTWSSCKNLLSSYGEAYYFSAFLDADQAQKEFELLLKHIHWRQERVRVFGKLWPQPRLVAWHGDPSASYRYSGLQLDPSPWTTDLARIRQKVESHCGQSFNSVLLNLYRDQSDSNGWHSDDEPELGDQPFIASLSLGQTRDFQLRLKQDHSAKVKLALESGSLLIMKGQCQKHWQHHLPKRKGPLGPRINLTFRQINLSYRHKSSI